MKKKILSVITAGIWITVSEFLRNELLFKNFWIDHFKSIGINFKTLPVNGVLWTIWSFILAYIIFKLLQRFSIKETISLAWMFAFVMMWIVTYNLQVLPLKLLAFALPLSIIEVSIAVFIIKKTGK
jgi:hypothetical protein